MVCFMAYPLLKYRNFKDYKTLPPDLLREQKHLNILLFSLSICTGSLWNIVLSSIELPLYHHGLVPDYLANLITLYEPVRTLRSSRSLNLSVPRSRTSTYGDRSFTCSSPNGLWNKLTDFIRYSETLDSFKTRLKNGTFLKPLSIYS